MTIAIEPLRSTDDLLAAVALQRMTRRSHQTTLWDLTQLQDVLSSGGLVLGARDAAPRTGGLTGVLVDLIAEIDGYPARRTVVHQVVPSHRNQGIGQRLRLAERTILRRQGVDLVIWDIDPLSSQALHVALNKLAAIGTAVIPSGASPSEGLRAGHLSAGTRIRLEWWLDAPRVVSQMGGHRSLPHQHLGLHEMSVLNKTTLLPSGVRGLLNIDSHRLTENVLFEIPEALDDLRSRDPEAEIQWRAHGCDALRRLFGSGYLCIGLVHEAGRSFMLFREGSRNTELR